MNDCSLDNHDFIEEDFGVEGIFTKTCSNCGMFVIWENFEDDLEEENDNFN
jgi:hypothetical protein